MMWLIKLNYNWADEIDVEGFSVMSTGDFTQWARTVEAVSKKIDTGCPFEWYIGTNQWIDWGSGFQFKESFSCEVITDQEAENISRLLIEGYGHFGFFPSGEEMLSFLEE